MRRAREVTEHASGALAIEHMLTGKRAQPGADVRRQLRSELDELFLCRHRQVVAADLAARSGAPADRQPDVSVIRLKEVRGDGMTELMTRDGDLVPLGVLDRDCEANR